MNKAFDLIEKKLCETNKKRMEYLEADNNKMASYYSNLYYTYSNILDLMIDGKKYRDEKQKKLDER